MLRHSAPHFQSNSKEDCVLSGGTQRRALPRHQSENINLNKYLISSIGDPTHNQLRLQSHTFILLEKND